MKCTLNSNIKSISGKVGSLLFKTYTKPDGTKETRAYGLPRKENGKFGYERKCLERKTASSATNVKLR